MEDSHQQISNLSYVSDDHHIHIECAKIRVHKGGRTIVEEVDGGICDFSTGGYRNDAVCRSCKF